MKISRSQPFRRLVILVCLTLASAVTSASATDDQSGACLAQCEAVLAACAADGRPWTTMGWCEYNYTSQYCMTPICVWTGIRCEELPGGCQPLPD